MSSSQHENENGLKASIQHYALIEALRSSDISSLDTLLEQHLHTGMEEISLTESVAKRLGVEANEAKHCTTVLHLACSFATRDVVKHILSFPKVAATINVQNEKGNTPLHIAATGGRLDIMDLLLAVDHVNDTIKNADGKTPLDVANEEVSSLIKAYREEYVKEKTELMIQYAKSGDALFYDLLKSSRALALVDLNIQDSVSGDYLLHMASKRGDATLVAWLLDHGADHLVRDQKGKLPVETTRNEAVKILLKNVSPKNAFAALQPGEAPPRLQGLLYKWTNYAHGYKARWFVLEEGVLSYYKNREDYPNSCRGSVNMQIAKIWIDHSDRQRFDIVGKGSVRYHLRADHRSEAHRWILALNQSKLWYEEAVKKGNRRQHRSGSMSSASDIKHFSTSQSLAVPSQPTSVERLNVPPTGDPSDTTSEASEELRISKERVVLKLNSAVSQLECQREIFSSIMPLINPNVDNGKLAISTFKQSLTSLKALIQECTDLFEKREAQWAAKLELESNKNKIWEESLRALAIENHQLEEKAGKLSKTFKLQKQLSAKSNPKPSNENEKTVPSQETLPGEDILSEEDMDEFYDAPEFERPSEVESHSEQAVSPVVTSHDVVEQFLASSLQGYGEFRKEIPLDFTKLQSSMSIWSVIKNAIGKDLSRVTIPVHFNEPLGMLQRMAEDMEYANLIDIASAREESLERILFVAAFAMSNYSSTVSRTTKPFNPLLGETFEYVRKDFGFRYVSEQVSHHPPLSACFCESPNYSFFSEVNVKSQFWGKSLEVCPVGVCHLILNLPNGEREHYSWKKVTTSVHNLIVGKLWIDHYGDMVVKNHKTGDQCILTFKQRTWTGKNACAISGKAMDATGKEHFEVYGTWNDKLMCRPCSVEENALEEPKEGHEVSKIKGKTLLWQRHPTAATAAKCFNQTEFAMTLNQIFPGMEQVLCPTDSRLRPDQRFMEEGDYDKASEEKARLEDKQRKNRKLREEKMTNGEVGPYSPLWFMPDVEPDTGEPYWRFTHEYWKKREQKDWNDVPDIF